jgi:hypothetical protein
MTCSIAVFYLAVCVATNGAKRAWVFFRDAWRCFGHEHRNCHTFQTKTPREGGALVCRDGLAPLSPTVRRGSSVRKVADHFGVSAFVDFAALPFNSITTTSNA